MGRQQQIESLFQEALQHPAVERDVWLRKACNGDSGLQREVVSLLANYREDDASASWAAAAAVQLMDAAQAGSLQPGQSLGPYRIDSFLAAGGMGEVYRATDTRLHREVAIKVSAARFSERFEREARVIASLNHPHICQLYDVGPNYLVMEFVDGAPLKGPLPVGKGIEYARQILDALDAAHRKGITHRDLKPANILLTKAGVKLLDFGLAKQSSPLKETDATRALTEQGQIAGTLQYMSPEQLQGKDADARSDLFSFGCVLYEMLSGRRAFEGQSAASVIGAILEREPVPIDVSPPLDRVVRRCLAKDPDQRFQNALDLKTALTWAAEQPAVAKTSHSTWMAFAAVALVIGWLAGWTVSRYRNKPADDRVIRLQIPAPEGGGISGGGNLGAGFAISPDGRSIAFIGVVNGKSGLWVRPLDATNARLIRGTEGARRPFFSPDGGSIAFSVASVLQRVDLSRETISRICDIPGPLTGGAWSSEGRILFGTLSGGIYQVPDSGGTPVQFTRPDRAHGEVTHYSPQLLPGGHILYRVLSGDPQTAGVYVTSLAKPAERVRLLENAREAWFTSGGDGEDYLLWIRDRTLLAQRFNSGTLQLIGEPHLLADPADAVTSAGRVLLYGSSIALRQFKWMDPKGNEIGPLGEPGPWIFSRISLDGKRVVTIASGDPANIWLLETGRGVANRLTSGRGARIEPMWSPDGRTILYSFGAPFNIFRIGSDGGGGEERVTQSVNRQLVDDWSRDGQFILYSEIDPETGRDLWFVPVTREGKIRPGASPSPLVRDRFDQFNGRFSPDTRWVAYTSDESGQNEVYVRSFPESREKLRISTGGGTFPKWGPGSRELFYLSRDGKLMAVTLKLGGTSPEASLPRELFALQTDGFGNAYEITADGQRFLVGGMAASREPLNVIIKWPELLKKGAGAP
jgi:Tol biopolymer transport system component/predicted Ser/Thr protein kinase